MDKISIGNILRNMRQTNTAYSQKELGKLVSLSDTTISSYERENSQPDFNTIVKIANLCNYDLYFYDKKAKRIISLEDFSKEL